MRHVKNRWKDSKVDNGKEENHKCQRNAICGWIPDFCYAYFPAEIVCFLANIFFGQIQHWCWWMRHQLTVLLPGAFLAAANLPPSVKIKDDTDTVNHCMWAHTNARTTQNLQLGAFTFNDFGNSLWFLIDQIWVSMDGGDLREVWAWTFKTWLLDPTCRTICPSHTIMYGVTSTQSFKNASCSLFHLEVTTFLPYVWIQICKRDYFKEERTQTFEKNLVLFGIKSLWKETLPSMIWGSFAVVCLAPPSDRQRRRVLKVI